MTLEERYAARLAESEIDAAEAKLAGIKLLRADQVVKLYAGAPRQDAIQLVYMDPFGRPTDFYRLRLLGDPIGGVKLEKPRRYLQPPRTGVRAYFPKVKGLDWRDVLTDPEIPLLITEGEFKSLCASVHDFPCIGLGGVESWREKGATHLLLKELEAAKWENRNVYICYDSDVATKPQVMVAAARLSEELGAHGAHVYDAGLPTGATDAKVGLDDFIRDRGVKALHAHLHAAPEFQHVRALHEFNERFIFVRTSGKVYEPSTDDGYEASKFCTAIEANTKYLVPKMTDDGIKMEKRSVPKDWLEWPRRRTVQRYNYVPGEPGLIVVGADGALELNQWHGWGAKPVKGDVRLWKQLFEHLTSGEEADVRKWFEQWLAYPLQNPGAKLHTAVCIWSSQTGTGKSLLGETMLRIYGRNGATIGVKQLQGSFNGWAARKQFIMGEEITGSEQRQHADELKGLITGKTININEKFEKEYVLPNLANFYFNSNHPDAFFLEDKDRRYLILEGPAARLPQSFYDAYEKWYKSDEGINALFDYLLSVDLDDFHPYGEAPRTNAHSVMLEQNKSDVGRFVTMCITDPEGAQKYYNVPMEIDLFTARELHKFYDPRGDKKASERAISLELQKHGARKMFGGAQMRINGSGQLRIFALRNQEKWTRAAKRVVMKYFEERELPTPKF